MSVGVSEVSEVEGPVVSEVPADKETAGVADCPVEGVVIVGVPVIQASYVSYVPSVHFLSQS